MFVINPISAVLFTLVVTLLDKTVAAKRVRQATAYDSAAAGMVLHPAHSVPDGKEADRLLQSSTITSCDVPGEGPIIANWNGGSCYGSVSYCCGPIPVYAFTTCRQGYYPYLKNWKNGVCSASDASYCCVTYVTSCDEPGEGKLSANFYWNSDDEYSYCYPSTGDCCGPLQKFTTPCSGYEPLNWPSAWIDGVCSAADKYFCCYHEDGKDIWPFSSCHKSQERIPRVWIDDKCKAYYLSDCCRSVSGTTSSGNGGTTSSVNGTTSSGNGGTTSSGNGGTTSSVNGTTSSCNGTRRRNTKSSGGGGTSSGGSGGTSSRDNGGTTSSGYGGTTPRGIGRTACDDGTTSSSKGRTFLIVFGILILVVLLIWLSTFAVWRCLQKCKNIKM
jgi:hypothetical protein